MEDQQSPIQVIIANYKKLGCDILSFIRRFSCRNIVLFLLFAAVLYYAVVFSLFSILLQETFNTQAFDAGIGDQANWLLSRFLIPFITIRGLNFFGDHVSLYHFIFVPAFWLWNNINALYILQSLLISLGAIPLFYFAKERLKSDWLALCVSLIYLLYPALQNMNLDQYHSEVIAVLFVILTLIGLFKKEYRLYYFGLIASLVGKDEIALTGIFIGLYLIFAQKEFRHGRNTLLISISWYLLCSRIFMPFFNEVGIFAQQPITYSHWFRGLSANFFNPWFYLQNLFHLESLRYYFGLLVPLAFIPLFSSAALFISIPSIAANVLSGTGYLRSIEYHYNYVQTAVLIFGLIQGLAFLKEKYPSRFHPALIGFVLLIVTLFANNSLSKFPLFNQWPMINSAFSLLSSDSVAAKNDGIKLIPPDAKVSASYSLVPHLSHRKEIYMFPNPFKAALWNQWFQEGRGLPPVEGHVDFLALDLGTMGEEDKSLAQNEIKANRFKIIYRDGPIIIMRKTSSREVSTSLTNSKPANSMNLLINGGFEKNAADVPDGWHIECWQSEKAKCQYLIDKITHKEGNFSAKLVHNDLADSRWVQEVMVTPKTYYKLSGWIKTDKVSLSGQGASLGFMGNIEKSKTFNGDTPWRYVEVLVKTSRKQKTLMVACRLGDFGAPTTGIVFFDQIELKEMQNIESISF